MGVLDGERGLLSGEWIVEIDNWKLKLAIDSFPNNLQSPLSNPLGGPLETKSSGNHNTLGKAERYLSY